MGLSFQKMVGLRTNKIGIYTFRRLLSISKGNGLLIDTMQLLLVIGRKGHILMDFNIGDPILIMLPNSAF